MRARAFSVTAGLARLLAGVALVIACASSALGQVVRGTVKEEDTGAPVDGAVVTLLAKSGARVGAALSGASGQFAVVAPGPGEYALEVKRIGLRRVRTEPFALVAGATREMSVIVSAAPVMQPEVRVSSRSQCGKQIEEGALLAEIWEDLRAALTATSVTQRDRLLLSRHARYQRRLDASGERVLAEQRTEQEGVTENPFQSLSPAILSRRGYVDTTTADTVIYYAPDATVLMSDQFVADHCFKLVRGEAEERGWLGVAFEPTSRRRRPEIEGVLWMNAANRELRRVDFRYTTLRSLGNDARLGGRVEFARMPAGTWIVSRWWIRMPGLTAKTGPVIPGMGRNERLSIQYVQEEGGEVISATVGRRTIALQSSSTLIGTVFDSTRRAPLAGAVVHLAGTSHQTRTDSAGSFRLSGLPEGTYTLRVEHPRLDSLGTAARELATSLARGEERRVSLFIPSVATIMAVHCPRSRLLDSAAVLRGVVRSKEGAPLAGVSLALSWNASAASTSRTLEDRRVVAESESGRDGAYVLCGPPDQLLELRLTRGASTVLLPIRLTAGTITAKDVELEASTGH